MERRRQCNRKGTGKSPGSLSQGKGVPQESRSRQPYQTLWAATTVAVTQLPTKRIEKGNERMKVRSLVLGADSFSKQLGTYCVPRILPDLEDISDRAPELRKLTVWGIKQRQFYMVKSYNKYTQNAMEAWRKEHLGLPVGFGEG